MSYFGFAAACVGGVSVSESIEKKGARFWRTPRLDALNPRVLSSPEEELKLFGVDGVEQSPFVED